MRLLWRLTLCAALGALAYGALYEPEKVALVARSLTAQLQAVLPVGGTGEGTARVAEGYRRLQENSMVGLYGAANLFAQAAALEEHDVCARAGQADAQLALAFAYGTSADLMAAHVKSLHGPQRRAADRLVREERRQAQEHLHTGQQFAKEAVRLSPIAFVALRAMAGALLQAGRSERARPYLAQASAARPNDVGVRLLLAQQKAFKEPQVAIGFLTSLLASEPQHNGARLRLALLHLRQDDRAAARQDALVILAGSSGHTLAQRLLMGLEPMAGDGPQMSRLMPLPTAAEVALLLPEPSRVHPADIDSPSSSNSSWGTARATSRTWLGRGARAAAEGYGLCVTYGRPLAHVARESLIGLAAWAGGEAPGVQQAPAAAPTEPGSQDFAALVAQAKAQQQRRERGLAEQSWQRALNLAPTHGEVLVALGWCRLQARDTTAAMGYFGRAVAAAPNNGEAHFGLAEAKRMAHDGPGAKASYERYLTLEPHGPLAPLCHQMLEESGHEG